VRTVTDCSGLPMTVAQPASARADIVATIGNRIKEIVKKTPSPLRLTSTASRTDRHRLEKLEPNDQGHGPWTAPEGKALKLWPLGLRA
jgi:hypothetical protein